MARSFRKTRGAGRRSGASRVRSMRTPPDWVETLEGWDNTPGIGDVQIDMAANEEFFLPLVNTWTSWGWQTEDNTTPPGQYTRGLPWPRRRVLRVKGWVHTSSPSYFTGNAEMLLSLQLEKVLTDPATGNVVPYAPSLLSTNLERMDATTYGKWQHYLAHHSSWTSPDDFTTFKKSFFINKKLNVVLDEFETLAMSITWRCFEGTPRLLVRPFLRTLVQTG